MKEFTKQLAIVFLGLGLATPLYAVDSTSSPRVEIINNVSSSASTGGNSAGSGEVIQGESKAQIKIYTEVDGEVVTDISEEAVGPEAKVERSVEVEEEGRSSFFAFLSKIFKYVFFIF